jgi:hypothetical protein
MPDRLEPHDLADRRWEADAVPGPLVLPAQGLFCEILFHSCVCLERASIAQVKDLQIQACRPLWSVI